MASGRRVALVTGANKGIGLSIVRHLCRQFSGDVVLTARDAARGEAAVQQLQAEGLSPRFHQLDIVDLQSIRALRDFLRREYGGLNVLVNNAGIAFKSRCGSGRWLDAPPGAGRRARSPHPRIHSSDREGQRAPLRMPSAPASCGGPRGVSAAVRSAPGGPGSPARLRPRLRASLRGPVCGPAPSRTGQPLRSASEPAPWEGAAPCPAHQLSV